ncbi:hypothetical protein ACQJBY_054014 [Aegilops geniculata]
MYFPFSSLLWPCSENLHSTTPLPEWVELLLKVAELLFPGSATPGISRSWWNSKQGLYIGNPSSCTVYCDSADIFFGELSYTSVFDHAWWPCVGCSTWATHHVVFNSCVLSCLPLMVHGYLCFFSLFWRNMTVVMWEARF